LREPPPTEFSPQRKENIFISLKTGNVKKKMGRERRFPRRTAVGQFYLRMRPPEPEDDAPLDEPEDEREGALELREEELPLRDGAL
jgi:hypothetical protein